MDLDWAEPVPEVEVNIEGDDQGDLPAGDDDQWSVVSHKKQKKRGKMTYEKARNYQRTHNIKNLARTLVSVEARNLQEDGWVFYKVIKDGQDVDRLPGMKYTYIPIPNEWRDMAYFKRPILEDEESS